MKYELLIDISRALLLARWKQTLVAAIGVTFSITMFISLLSFMSGLNQLLDGLVINRTPHIRLYNDIKTSPVQPVALSANFKGASHHFVRSVKPKAARPEIRNSLAIIRALQKDPMVLGVAPKLVTQVFYNLGAVRINGIINGIQPEQEKRLFLFQDYVTSGAAGDLDRVSGGIILGKDIADKMMAAPGQVIYVTTITGTTVPLKVVGYFQSGLREIDQVNSYVSISTAQKLVGKPSNYITDIQIKLYDVGDAPALAIGFVFQFHYLLNEFSVLQNVMLPALRLGRWEADEIRQRAYDKLVTLDMAQHAQKKPNQLSGGQKQRVAIARALINDPLIIMGDEPTGNLDKRNSEIVFETFLQLAQTQGQTLLIVTHDQEFARRTGRTIQMQDGRVA